jgi:hypothetical protein
VPALERSWKTSGALRIEDSTILVIVSGIFKVPLLTLQVLVSKPISGLRDNPRRFASLTPPLDSPRGVFLLVGVGGLYTAQDPLAQQMSSIVRSYTPWIWLVLVAELFGPQLSRR